MYIFHCIKFSRFQQKSKSDTVSSLIIINTSRKCIASFVAATEPALNNIQVLVPITALLEYTHSHNLTQITTGAPKPNILIKIATTDVLAVVIFRSGVCGHCSCTNCECYNISADNKHTSEKSYNMVWNKIYLSPLAFVS